MRWPGKASLRFFQGQRGISLIETLVAVLILGFIGVAFLAALTTTTKSIDLYEQRFTASALAQSQIEILKAAPYDYTLSYDETVSAPTSLPRGYDILISAVPQEDGNKQEITVKVSRDGHHLLELTTIKANW